MPIMSLVTSAALMMAVASPVPGVQPVERITMQMSVDAISAIRLPEGQKIVDVVVQDPLAIEVSVAGDRTIALRGAPDARGTHLLVRRAGAKPLDVLLVPTTEAVRSQVLRIGAEAALPIAEWHVDSGRLSLLRPGFAVVHAYSTTGLRIESLGSDGSLVATRGSADRGDVLVVGSGGEIGIYRLD